MRPKTAFKSDTAVMAARSSTSTNEDDYYNSAVDFEELKASRTAMALPLQDRTNLMHLMTNPSLKPFNPPSGKTTASFGSVMYSAPLTNTSAKSCSKADHHDLQ